MKIQMVNVELLKPYPKNAKKHEPEQVERVANSLREFGWRQPIVIDGDNYVVAGHCRLLAAKRLGQTEVPCVGTDDLTDEQIKAYRLADNKTNECEWDTGLLDAELDEILSFDMSDFGFSLDDDSPEAVEDEREYQEFVDKFKPKLTTDDCYTPEAVYDAVKTWAVERYELQGREIIRPFYPGGDYQNHEYPDGCVVIDNPPFSIATEIINHFNERGIDYFLFADHLTLFTAKDKCNYIACKAQIIYRNGANVATSFRTNMGEYLIDTAPSLYEAIESVQITDVKELTKYDMPPELCTASRLGTLAPRGVELKIKKGEAYHVRELDGMKEVGKPTIFGSGFLLSESATQAQAQAQAVAERPKVPIALSERERIIVRSLSVESETTEPTSL